MINLKYNFIFIDVYLIIIFAMIYHIFKHIIIQIKGYTSSISEDKNVIRRYLVMSRMHQLTYQSNEAENLDKLYLSGILIETILLQTNYRFDHPYTGKVRIYIDLVAELN